MSHLSPIILHCVLVWAANSWGPLDMMIALCFKWLCRSKGYEAILQDLMHPWVQTLFLHDVPVSKVVLHAYTQNKSKSEMPSTASPITKAKYY